ncbi:hypothetical protein [Streptomyces sp. NPDC005435]|uniref:hypothetical protein n=1 Tax=Streptomyces sp. NPDC005435 TaxID=3154464 RepID=UPI0034544322
MSVDLGVGPGVLKKGAGDILECITPAKGVKPEDAAEEGESLGDDDAVAAMVTFSATWKLGVDFLLDCGATLAEGLKSADSDYAATDQRIRGAVNAVKSDLG